MNSSIPVPGRGTALPTSFRAVEETTMLKFDRLWTLKDIANHLSISYAKVVILARCGKLKKIGRKVGKRWRFYPPNVIAYFKGDYEQTQ